MGKIFLLTFLFIGLADQVGPIQFAALTKEYAGRANQASPGSVAPPSAWDRIMSQTGPLPGWVRLSTASFTGLAEIYRSAYYWFGGTPRRWGS